MKQKKEVVYKFQISHLLLWILEIARHDVEGLSNFEEAYRKRLKFQKLTDWRRYRASVDLLEDTEIAIVSGFEYQLGDLSSKNKDTGETNLRLYGILNAVYLQMSAFKEIANLLNYPPRGKLGGRFKNLDIYKLRGIAGSHTVDYIFDKQTLQDNPKINKTTSFRIVQMHLEKTGENITALDENNITVKFNLLKVLAEYEKVATNLLVELINHTIKTLVYKKEDKDSYKKQLADTLPHLIDYTKIDKNKKYNIQEKKRVARLIKDIRLKNRLE